MILGLSDTEKKFKTAMDTAGADMTVVNSWLKLYVKTKKNSSGVAKRYYGVKTGLSSLLSDLKELEQQVIGYCELTGTCLLYTSYLWQQQNLSPLSSLVLPRFPV